MNRIKQADDDYINVLVMAKGEQRYVFQYTDANRPGVLRAIGRYAGDPKHRLTWCDAARLSQKVRMGKS